MTIPVTHQEGQTRYTLKPVLYGRGPLLMCPLTVTRGGIDEERIIAYDSENGQFTDVPDDIATPDIVQRLSHAFSKIYDAGNVRSVHPNPAIDSNVVMQLHVRGSMTREQLEDLLPIYSHGIQTSLDWLAARGIVGRGRTYSLNPEKTLEIAGLIGIETDRFIPGHSRSL
jgi:hypothetical protein